MVELGSDGEQGAAALQSNADKSVVVGLPPEDEEKSDCCYHFG